MKCIITGASGFIGSYLCNFLKKKGHSVIPLSRTLPAAFLNQLRPEYYLEGDVSSEQFPLQKASADLIIHLASANEVVSRDVKKGIDNSVLGTKHVLDFAVNNRIPNVMFFSTFQVYGTNPTGHINELTAVMPDNDYALNHLFAEQYVEMYARKGLIRAAIIRPVNVYGRFDASTVNRWTMVPACFCKEAVHGKTITIRSSGKQTRSFISLENVARAVEAVWHQFPEHCDVVIAGSKHTNSILQVAMLVKQVHQELTGEEAELVVDGDEPERPNVFDVSIDKLLAYGYKPNERPSMKQEIRHIMLDLLKKA